ncbi:MAG: hypothetical protein AAFP84_12540 [Actinomycetota bacterium]
MELVVRSEHGEAEVAVTGSTDGLTVGDVVATVLGGRPPAIVRIDGRPLRGDTVIGAATVVAGAVVEHGGGNGRSVHDDVDPTVVLAQVAGFGAGTSIELAPGDYLIGPTRRVNLDDLSPAPVDEPVVHLTIGENHAVSVRRPAGVPAPDASLAQVTVDGTPVEGEPVRWSAGPLVVDGRAFTHRRHDPALPRRRPAATFSGRRSVNRPPRPTPRDEPVPLVVPDLSATVTAARSRSRFATLRRGRRNAAPPESVAEAEFRAAAQRAHSDEELRRRSQHPDLGEMSTTIEESGPHLWERRPADRDGFVLAVGLGDLPWRPRLEHRTDTMSTAEAIVERVGPLRSVPIEVDLREHRGIGIAGALETATDVARGVVITACTTHGPADVDVVVVTSADRRATWEWTKWLPHARIGGAPRILHDEQGIEAWAASVVAEWKPPTRPTMPSHLTLVVVDDAATWRHRGSPLRPLLADPSLPMRFVALADAVSEAPSACTSLVVLETNPSSDAAPFGTTRLDGTPCVTVDDVLTQTRVDDVAVFALTEPVALRLARRLAPFDDPDLLDTFVSPSAPMASTPARPAVVPFVLGRPLGPLETRLRRAFDRSDHGDGDQAAELIPVPMPAPPADLATAADEIASTSGRAPRGPVRRRTRSLPRVATLDHISDAAQLGADRFTFPVGLVLESGEPAVLEVPFGEHALVGGPARSGRSATLHAMAAAIRLVAPELAIFAVAPRGGPLARDLVALRVDAPASPAEVGDWVTRIEAASGPRLVLVDDADRVGGPSFATLAAITDRSVSVVLGGQPAALRAAAHWSAPLQPWSRSVLIQPTASDGDLVGTSLGTRLPRFPRHHGLLVARAETTRILVATADATAGRDRPAPTRPKDDADAR